MAGTILIGGAALHSGSLFSSEVAAWVQGLGSLAAVGAAIGVSIRQTTIRGQERAAVVAMRRRSAAHLAAHILRSSDFAVGQLNGGTGMYYGLTDVDFEDLAVALERIDADQLDHPDAPVLVVTLARQCRDGAALLKGAAMERRLDVPRASYEDQIVEDWFDGIHTLALGFDFGQAELAEILSAARR